MHIFKITPDQASHVSRAFRKFHPDKATAWGGARFLADGLAVPSEIADLVAVLIPDKRSAQIEQRRAEAKAECGRRIEVAFPTSAQMNLAAAAAIGVTLTDDQVLTYVDAVAWVQDMRARVNDLALSDLAIDADENWPPMPDGMADLVALF